jgi:hypothetical protein
MKTLFAKKQTAQRKTVAGVIASFQRTIEELGEIATRNNNEAALNDETIAQLQAENSLLSSEASKAANVAKKIAELVS